MKPEIVVTLLYSLAIAVLLVRILFATDKAPIKEMKILKFLLYIGFLFALFMLGRFTRQYFL